MVERPLIFVSSTTGELAPYREAARLAIEQDLGWRAWLFQRDGASGPPTVDVLEPAIQRADALLWIIGDEYGTTRVDEPLSWTEWEVLAAHRLGKRVIPYIRNETRQTLSTLDERQRNAIAVLTSDTFVNSVSTPADFRSRLSRDLLHLTRHPVARTSTFSRAVAQSARRPILLSDSEAESLLTSLLSLRREERFSDALTAGERLIDEYFGPRGDRGELGDLELARDFTRTYYELLALAGRFTGRISAISMARAWFELEVLRGDLDGAVEAAQCASGVLAGGGAPALGLQFVQWSLAHATTEQAKGSAYDGHAHIYWRLRHKGRAYENQAIECLRNAEPRLPDPLVKAYVKSSLAAKFFSVGHQNSTRSAGRLFEEADSMAGAGLTRVIYSIHVLPFLHGTGTQTEAAQTLDRGIHLCDQLGLAQPKLELIGLGLSMGI